MVKCIHWITRFNQWITLTSVLGNPVQNGLPQFNLSKIMCRVLKDHLLIGSSLIAKPSVHAQYIPMGLNLGFNENDYKLVWAGMSGMSSYCVFCLIHSMVNWFGLPSVVLIHCGGNGIGIEPCWKLLLDMKFIFLCNFSNPPWK